MTVDKNVQEQQQQKETEGGSRERQPAGSVLAEKNFEPLDSLLQAYEARLKPLETLEERWKLKLTNCPKSTETHPSQDKIATRKQPQIPEEATKEIHDNDKERILTRKEMPLNQQSSQGNEIKTTLRPNTSIPEVEENWGYKLWEAVKRTQKMDEGQNEKPPLEEIDFDQKTLEIKIR